MLGSHQGCVALWEPLFSFRVGIVNVLLGNISLRCGLCWAWMNLCDTSRRAEICFGHNRGRIQLSPGHGAEYTLENSVLCGSAWTFAAQKCQQ